MTTLSVSESLRELFAVDVAVLGLSRPPALTVLGSLLACDDLSDCIAAASGVFGCIEVTSWIDGRPCTNNRECIELIDMNGSAVEARGHSPD